MLRKEPPGLGLLGLGLKPTTSTLSYIPERRERRLISLWRIEERKDQSVVDGVERKRKGGREGGREEFTSS